MSKYELQVIGFPLAPCRTAVSSGEQENSGLRYRDAPIDPGLAKV